MKGDTRSLASSKVLGILQLARCLRSEPVRVVLTVLRACMETLVQVISQDR